FRIDIPGNPAGAVILPQDTARSVRFRFRFRSTAPDPCACGAAVGMLINDFRLEWQSCDFNACAPGLPGRGERGRGTTSPPGGTTVSRAPARGGAPATGSGSTAP